ncbi:hypothetical protein MMC34_001699 [Xylographa carneopallida]|nr:hypothetical protein [Xylographa carneopallida]
MVLNEYEKGFPPTVYLKYKCLVFAEAMLYRSARSLLVKTEFDSYGLSFSLEGPASEDVPQPRSEVLPPFRPFGSTPAGSIHTPFGGAPLAGSIFGNSSSQENVPKPFSLTVPSSTSSGLSPSASTMSSSTIRPSTSPSISDLSGTGAASPSPAFSTDNPGPSTSTPSPALFRSGARFGQAAVDSTNSHPSIFQNAFSSGTAPRPNNPIPAGTTAPSCSTQPWPSFGGFGTTPIVDVPQPTGNHTSRTSVFSHPNPAVSAPRAEQLKTKEITPTSATPSASSIERERLPYAYTPSPTQRQEQICGLCKNRYSSFFGCFCEMAARLKTPAQQNENGTKPAIRVKLPPAPNAFKDTKEKSKAFQAKCEDFHEE